MLLQPPLPGNKLSAVHVQYEACGNSSEPGRTPHVSARNFIATTESVDDWLTVHRSIIPLLIPT